MILGMLLVFSVFLHRPIFIYSAGLICCKIIEKGSYRNHLKGKLIRKVPIRVFYFKVCLMKNIPM